MRIALLAALLIGLFYIAAAKTDYDDIESTAAKAILDGMKR